MTKETKTVTSSVNLPISSVDTIINVDDRNFEIPIESILEDFKEKKIEFIRTMNTVVEVDDYIELTKETKYVNPENIHINEETSYINNIEKRTINDENMDFLKKNLKFYKVEFEFATGKKAEYVFPSYVKFYSMHKAQFIPVADLKNRDILCDYAKRMVKVSDAELIEDVQLDSEYYNIKVTFDRQYDEELGMKEYPNLYINGILANIAYMNFNKTFTDTPKAE